MNILPVSVASETRLALAALLLAALPAAAQAQGSTQDSLLRSGDLVGGRPHASTPRTAAQAGPAARPTGSPARATGSADPGLTRMINESVDLSRASAADMPNLYQRFIEATRDQRRKWTDRDWADASATLSRLNARYEAVRLDLPLEDRLRVRTLQGEFRTYENARRVNQKLDNAGVNLK